ncbi:MAG: AAA family ATPase, partial [Clostridia bacterium]|nr:AAA family ATPase [Clostridia bacterium]
MGLEDLIQSTEDMPSISGSVQDVIFRNATNDYTVLAFLTDDGEEIVAVGCMPDVQRGETLLLYGDWSYHATYGQQFTVENFQKTLPTESEDILKYLSSGVIRGIGPVTALKIVNRFGVDTFDVIEHHPTWLADIPGITRKKAAEINRQFCSQNGLRKLMMCCRDYLGMASISRVYREWGDNAISIIEENPYRLCDEIYGVGFDRADAIAQKLGVVNDSEFRITSGLRYVLGDQANNQGHTCLPRQMLVSLASEKLRLPIERIEEVLSVLLKRRHLVQLLPENNEYIFTSNLDKAEAYVAKKLLELSGSCEVMSDHDIARLIAITEAERNIQFARLQCVAIREALSNGVMILTGGPGTGKTTVVRALIRMFKQMQLKTALAAPTGRAAKRMSEATGEEARTIHRMLEMEKSETG